MAEIVLAQANPASLFKGVEDPGFDGELVRMLDPYAKHLSLFDLGFIRGDGIFEATTMMNHTPYALRLHLGRLARSARMMDLPELADEQTWLDAIMAVVEAYDGEDLAMVKIMVSRGSDASTSVGRMRCPGVPTVWIFVDPIDPAFGKKPSIRADIVTRGYSLETVQSGDPWLLLGAKTLSYAPNMAAYREASRRGVDILIYRTTDNYILEGGTSSIVIQKNGEFTTPIPDLGILHGTSQQEFFAYAEKQGIPHSYGLITVDELLDADHVYNLGGSIVQCVERIGDKDFATDEALAADAIHFWRTEREYVEGYTLGVGARRWL